MAVDRGNHSFLRVCFMSVNLGVWICRTYGQTQLEMVVLLQFQLGKVEIGFPRQAG